MIFGFGSIEREEALSIIRECKEAMKSESVDGLEVVQAHYKKLEASYKRMSRDEAPERYSYFFARPHRIYEGKAIIEFTFHHINRRHPFSPDGWALLVTNWILSIDPLNDGDLIYCQA